MPLSILLSLLCRTIFPDPVPQSTVRASVTSSGAEAAGDSARPTASHDGRFVVFESLAPNLAPGGVPGVREIFLHDRATGITELISVSTAGARADGPCFNPTVSDDGRFVGFWSEAATLVPLDTNGAADVFVRDRLLGVTERVSVSSAGAQANGDSHRASLSADGALVAFYSYATDLVPGDTNGRKDVFVRDRAAGTTRRVSLPPGGGQSDGHSGYPILSADGSAVSFYSDASNLVPGDTNGCDDVFVCTLATGAIERVSVSSAGGQGDAPSRGGSLSRDGRFAAFGSSAANLVPGDANGREDVFVRDRAAGVTLLVSRGAAGAQGDGDSDHPTISADGAVVAFYSLATNLDPLDANGGWDVFVHELATSRTRLASATPLGAAGNGHSYASTLTGDGRSVVFESLASDLVPLDANAAADVFLHRIVPPEPTLALLGACPGPIRLRVREATPLGAVLVFHGAPGSWTRAAPPCAGLTLGIGAPVLGARLAADAAGDAEANFPAPAAACGRTVQAVDAASCRVTNPATL